MRRKSGGMHNNVAAPRQEAQESGAKGFPGQASVLASLAPTPKTPYAARRTHCPRWPNTGGGSSEKKSSEKSIAARPHHQPPGQRLEVLRRRRCCCCRCRSSLPSQVSLLPTLGQEQWSAGGPLPGPLPQPPAVGPASLLRCWGRRPRGSWPLLLRANSI